MPSETLLLHFAEDEASATRIAQAANMAMARIERHRFPDGELKLRLPPQLPPHVVLLRTLDHPNEKLVELLLVARTARQLGATHLTLVAPYLAYMRQDIAFNPGEVVSQRVVGAFLAGLFDAVITVDPHLHRVATLEEAVPVPRAVVLSGPRCWRTGLPRGWKNPCWWAPMKSLPNGSPRRPHNTSLTLRYAAKCATATAMSKSRCRPSMSKTAMWSCSMMWPVAAIPWLKPRACCWPPGPAVWTWP